MNDGQEAFVNLVLAYAQAGSRSTGLEVSVILAQWADETGWGTSEHWTVGHNPAGISPGGTVASYDSIFDGVHAWISTMELPWYDAVRGAVGRQAQAVALGESPWAAGRYDNGGGPGSALLDLINDEALWLYDTPSPSPAPQPQPNPQPLEDDQMTIAAIYDPVQSRVRVFASDRDGDLIERFEQAYGEWYWTNVDAMMKNGTPPSIEATQAQNPGTQAGIYAQAPPAPEAAPAAQAEPVAPIVTAPTPPAAPPAPAPAPAGGGA